MSAIFGEDCRIHPITDMPIENGRGCLSDDQQAKIHCDVIEQQQGKAAGDAVRARLDAWLAGEQEGAIDTDAQEHEHQPEGTIHGDVD